jgi:hypothetical protein
MFVRRSVVLCALLILALSASPALAGQTRAAALAQERYYSSYGAPEPLTIQQPAPAPSGSSPLPDVLLAVAVAVGLAGAGAVQVRRVRGRRAAGATS